MLRNVYMLTRAVRMIHSGSCLRVTPSVKYAGVYPNLNKIKPSLSELGSLDGGWRSAAPHKHQPPPPRDAKEGRENRPGSISALSLSDFQRPESASLFFLIECRRHWLLCRRKRHLFGLSYTNAAPSCKRYKPILICCFDKESTPAASAADRPKRRSQESRSE